MQKNDWIDLRTVSEQYFKPGAAHPERLKTGFPDLDRALGGGLAPGLIMLGGTPGAGKSTLALQIAAYVAEHGHPVLYFSMEMPASQIAVKVMNRKLYEDKARLHSVSPDEMLYGALTRAQWDEVEVVKQKLPEQFYICTKSLSASDILAQARSFTDHGERPLVIIDYLQILRPEKGAYSDKQVVDANLRCLMQLAHNIRAGASAEPDGGTGDGLPVILISSLNRSSYKGAMTISSFKETGDIEYSADLLLGLQFRACRNKTFDPEEEKGKRVREMELTILKNRYGHGGAIGLQYEPDHDYFYPPAEEAAEDAQPKAGAAAPAPKERTSRKADQERAVNDLQVSPDAAGAVDAPDDQTGETSAQTRPRPFPCVINNTKIASEIRTGVFGDRSCRVFGDTYTRYTLSEPLSSLDCCVADAIYTLAQKQERFSLQAILQILLGERGVALTKPMRNALKVSIHHLRNIQFHLDCTEELQARKLLDDQPDWVYDGPFLSIEGPDGKDAYHPAPGADHKGILPLYTYGAKIKQMITIPSALLDVKKPDGRRLSNTQDNICLKRFLVRRMEVIRYEDQGTQKVRNHLRTISFRAGGNLLEELRIGGPPDSAAEQQLKRLHEATEWILTYFQQIGYLQFKRGREGRLPSFSIIDITKDLQTLKI